MAFVGMENEMSKDVIRLVPGKVLTLKGAAVAAAAKIGEQPGSGSGGND